MPTGPWQNHQRPGRRGFPPRTAKAILARDGQCQLALPGCTHHPDEADHILGWSEAEQLGWTPAQYNHPSNGQAVCTTCHQRKTQQQAAAGRRRAATQRQRPTEKHPGLID